MKDQYKTRNQLIEELGALRKQVVKMKRAETKRKRAEDKLKDSEERYRKLFDNAIDGIALADAETGILIDCNKAIKGLVGREKIELIGQSQKILHPPEESIGEVSRTFAQHRFDKEGSILETNVITKSGERKQVEIKANILELKGKRLLQGIFRDITERKRSEEVLRESEERFRMVLKSSMDNLYRRNLKTDNYDYMSPAVARISGYSPEEMISMPIDSVLSMIHPGDIGMVKRAIGEFMTSDIASYLIEYRFRHKDGQYRWLSDLFTVVKDAQGCPLYLVGNVRDITERKRSEEALRESEEKYRTLFEESRDAIYISMREGKFVDINKAGLELLGYTKEEIIKLDVQEIYANPDDRSRFQHEIERKGSVRDYEAKFRKKDRTEIDCLLTSTVRRADDGRIVGYQGIIRDITERKQAEEELRSSHEQLRALSAHLQSIREEERAQIAREIHDELGQELTVLKMDLSWLEKRIPQKEKLLVEKTQSMLKLGHFSEFVYQNIGCNLLGKWGRKCS